jgi:uncharacterized membrane protein
MKASTVLGIILVVLGIISLVYQDIHYTTNKKVVDIGSIHATKEEHHTVPLPPILGGLALVGGIVLVIAGAKGSA